MNALKGKCLAFGRATARLQPRGLRRSSQIGQQDGSAKARTRHIELLQKGISAERKSGHINLHGVKLQFGTFLVDQLQQLSRECSGRSARAFMQLSREGRAYAAWDAERRARHLEQVQSALGFLDWEDTMMPSRAANGVAISQHTPALAPHLRVRMSMAEDLSAHANGHALAASDGSQNGITPLLEEYPSLALGLQPGLQPLEPIQQHSGDGMPGDRQVESQSTASLQHLRNGHLENGLSPQLQESQAKADTSISDEAAASSIAVPLDNSASVQDSGGAESRHMTSLQGKRVRGIVFDTETTGTSTKKGFIIEIAAHDLESGETWTTLIKLPESVKVTNSHIHGITKAMVSEPSLPMMREAGQQLLDFIDRQCSAQNALPLLIAHNGKVFDIPVLHNELQRNGLALPEQTLYFDTLPYSRQILPQLGRPPLNYKQVTLREYFGIPEPVQAHRADQDVMILVKIVDSLLQLGVHGSLQEAVEASLRDNCTFAQHYSAALRKRTGPTRAELTAQSARKAAEEGIIGDEDPLLAVESQHKPSARARRSLQHLSLTSLPASSSANSISSLMQQQFTEHPKGFTEKQCKDLTAAGFESVGDLLLFFPRDHIAYESFLQHDAFVHIDGTILRRSVRVTRSVLIMEIEALVAARILPQGDRTGELQYPISGSGDLVNGLTASLVDASSQVKVKGKKVMSMFGGWGLKKKYEDSFAPGSHVIIRGKVSKMNGHWELETASAEFLEPGSKRAEPPDGLEPVYPQRTPLKAKAIPNLVAKALRALDALPGADDMDILPQQICAERNLMPWCQAVRSRHVPKSKQEAEDARQRLAFEELLVLQLRLLLQRTSIQASQPEGEGVCMGDLALMEAARDALGFQLTGGQETALDNVLRDLEGPAPMMCLLQGDVGCGKTAVAFLAIMAAAGSGFQAAMMLPTEILASQTHAKLQGLLERMPDDMQPRAAILTGSTRAKERREITAGVADGSINIIVGTHSLISESVQFNSLGLAIVDEQHRFGVEQRARLAAKATPSPHVMYMTATPIPRTLALCEHGDLALYTIDELPPGRQPVTTRVIKDSAKGRAQVYEAIQAELADGGRAYIICPLVGESSAKGFADTKAAEEEYKRLTEGGIMGPDVRYGLLHGRLSSEEKAAALNAFASGDTNVLIATTVVEVGVDVPEASVIVVEGADRFGLAALHQLRGRVGRGTRPSSCYLISSEASERIAILEHSHNGFRIAEADLIHRGPGDFLGKKQSGKDAFSSLKSARLPQDRQLLEDARRSAAMLCAEWRDGQAEPPALLLAVVHKQAKSLLDISQLSLPAAVVEVLEAL